MKEGEKISCLFMYNYHILLTVFTTSTLLLPVILPGTTFSTIVTVCPGISVPASYIVPGGRRWFENGCFVRWKKRSH